MRLSHGSVHRGCISRQASPPVTRCRARPSHQSIPMLPIDRITVDPGLMNGQPCLRHLRLTVRRVVEIAAGYPDAAERQREYPELEDEDVRQALHYAALHLPDVVAPLHLSSGPQGGGDSDAMVA